MSSHGQMDITAHQQTYAAFIKASIIGSASLVAVLTMIAFITLH
jgi:hypothetical protein